MARGGSPGNLVLAGGAGARPPSGQSVVSGRGVPDVGARDSRGVEARELRHDYIGAEHILLGLVRENEGLATRVLLNFDADPEKIRSAIIRSLGSPSSRSERAAAKAREMGSDPAMSNIDSTWLDWIAGSLDELAAEIREKHRRNPDSGDLLIVLAAASDMVASEMLRELGLDSEPLTESVQAARNSHAASDPHAQIERARREKEEAVKSLDFALAARFRNEERSLNQKLKGEQAAALEEIRVRLGLIERSTDD